MDECKPLVVGLLPEDSTIGDGIAGALTSAVALLPVGRAAHHSPFRSPQHKHLRHCLPLIIGLSETTQFPSRYLCRSTSTTQYP